MLTSCIDVELYASILFQHVVQLCSIMHIFCYNTCMILAFMSVVMPKQFLLLKFSPSFYLTLGNIPNVVLKVI